MNKSWIWIILTFNIFGSVGAQDCYQTFFGQGVEAYNTLDFEAAINQFEAAKICDDVPANNDIDEWINKAQNGYIDAIKAEQTKAQSLALTAQSILALLKKEDATKALRYAQLAITKDETPEARSALYECYYQLEGGIRKNFYVRDIQAFTSLNNSIRNAGFLDRGQTIFVFDEVDGIVRLFNFAGQLIGELESSVHWFDEQAHSETTGILLTTKKIDGHYQLIGQQLQNGQLREEQIFSYPSPAGDIKAAAVSKDGKFIVVSFNDGSGHVLNQVGELLYELPKEKNGARNINFSDEHQVALSYDKPIKVFDLSTKNYEILLDTIEEGMYNTQVRLSPKATYLMTGYGRRANLWDVAADTTIYATKNLSFQTALGMFSKDEKYMSYGQGFFNLEKRFMLNNFSSEVRHLIFSPDLRYTVANIGSNKARIWLDAKYNPIEHGVLGGHRDFIRQIAFSPDSTHVLTASVDNTVKIWNLRMRAANRISNAGTVLGTYVRTDTTFVATRYKDRLLFFTQDGQYSHSHYSQEQNILTIDPTGQYVFANVEDGFEVYGLDISSQYLTYVSGIRNTDTARFAQFLSDDQVVYYSDENLTYSLQVWNFKKGGARYLSGYNTELISLSCAADQKHVAALDNSGKAYLWEVPKEGAPVLLNSWIPHPEYGCSSITFSRDSKKIITSGYDNLANVWTLEGKLVTRLIDHLAKVNDADSTPDGQFMLTASEDKTAKIWTAEGALVATLFGYDYPLDNARFSEDGRYIITNNADGTLMIWPFDPALILEKMNNYQIPDLSDSERAEYD